MRQIGIMCLTVRGTSVVRQKRTMRRYVPSCENVWMHQLDIGLARDNNWEEGWRLEHSNVVKVHNLWGEAKIEIEKKRLPEMEREIVATITEIEERYERLRGFETLSGEDEEVRRTLVGIPNAIMLRGG